MKLHSFVTLSDDENTSNKWNYGHNEMKWSIYKLLSRQELSTERDKQSSIWPTKKIKKNQQWLTKNSKSIDSTAAVPTTTQLLAAEAAQHRSHK